MKREEFTNTFLPSTIDSYILQLPTGYGKTKASLDKIETWYREDMEILIVIPRLVNIKEWKKEIVKWNYNKYLNKITFSTYISIGKYCGNKEWDVVIFDEGHHTSERCREFVDFLKTKHVIVLSATLKREIAQYFKAKFNTKTIKIGVKEAIESEVLPDPKIILIPLRLSNAQNTEVIEKNFTKKNANVPVKSIKYCEKWKYKDYAGPLRIECSPLQYYRDISGLIEWYKKKGMFSSAMKNIWLHKAGERLKWLACQKEGLIKILLRILKNHRSLIFCPSIKQSETLGCPCVNSEVGLSNLEKFNAGKIKHVASIDMLNEGINPENCKIGLFQMINSSERISIQRMGRILRHKSPILIFPYYMYTREEEIVNKIIENYNPNLITKIEETNIKDLLKYV